MTQHIININKNENPEYHSILDEHNEIMDEWNRINKELHEFNYPRYFPFFQKRRLSPLLKSLKELQQRYLKWNKEAYDMIKAPKLTIPHQADNLTTFLHFTTLLRDIRNRLDSDMRLIQQNYNYTIEEISNKVNFMWAILSFLASFTGLIVAIAGLIIAIIMFL